MKLSAILAPLIAAKASHETIMEVVLAFESEQIDALAKRRESDAKRQAEFRKRNVTSRYVTVTERDTNPRAHVEDNLLKEDKSGKEGRKKEARGARIPDDFQPDLEVAVSEGLSRPEALRQARSFVDYWRAKPGKDALKLDWPATWRVWYRRNLGQAPKTSPPGAQTHPERVNAALDKIINGTSNAHSGPTIDASVNRTDRPSSQGVIQFDAAASGRRS